MGSTNVWSKTLTADSITIQQSQNVVRLSVLTRQGTVVFTGSTSFNGVAADAVTFSQGQGVTLTGSTTNPLDGITIEAATGGDIADIIISYQ
jgi:hypothetical protein